MKISTEHLHEFNILPHDTSSRICFVINITKKNNKQEIPSVELGVCPMQLFHLEQAHVTFIQFKICCCVQKSSKSDDFLLRYGDITIFNMVAVRHLGIVLPQYETTHEVFVAGRSCLSNVMSI